MRYKFRYIKIGVISGLLLLSILSVIVAVPKYTVAQSPSPIIVMVSWNLGQDVQEARVGPNDSGTAEFTGFVHCDQVLGGTYQKMVVNLTASSEQDWPIIVNPEQVIFTPNTDENIRFSVSVKAPSKTSMVIVDTITVSGNASAYPGEYSEEIEPIKATLRIEQFYDFHVNIEKNSQMVNKGNSAIYPIKITNTGNGRDIYAFSIKNEDELGKSGLKFRLSSDTIELESTAIDFTELIVETTDSSKSGKYEIKVFVKSEKEERNIGFSSPVESQINLTIKEDKQKYDLNSYLPILAGIVIVLTLFVLLIIWLRTQRSQKNTYKYQQNDC